MVIGTSLNLLVQGGTTFLLYLLFGLRGVLNDPKLVTLYRRRGSGCPVGR